MTRANRLAAEDPDSLSRRAITSFVEREKERRRLDSDKAKEEPVPAELKLCDELGKCWILTVNSKGELKASPKLEEPK